MNHWRKWSRDEQIEHWFLACTLQCIATRGMLNPFPPDISIRVVDGAERIYDNMLCAQIRGTFDVPGDDEMRLHRDRLMAVVREVSRDPTCAEIVHGMHVIRRGEPKPVVN